MATPNVIEAVNGTCPQHGSALIEGCDLCLLVFSIRQVAELYLDDEDEA